MHTPTSTAYPIEFAKCGFYVTWRLMEKEGREAKPSGFPKDFVKANEASGGDGRAG